jgi:hypothetical protein
VIGLNAATTTYVLIFLAALVAFVVAVVLFYLGRRMRREQTFVGFTPRSKDEKYVGYFLLATGLVIMFLSIYEMVTILTSGVSSTAPFGLSELSPMTGDQSAFLIPAQILGTIEGISFWLVILVSGGRKIASLGLDMLKGRKIKLRRTLRKS